MLTRTDYMFIYRIHLWGYVLPLRIIFLHIGMQRIFLDIDIQRLIFAIF